jgi:hypothetical protein
VPNVVNAFRDPGERRIFADHRLDELLVTDVLVTAIHPFK